MIMTFHTTRCSSEGEKQQITRALFTNTVSLAEESAKHVRDVPTSRGRSTKRSKRVARIHCTLCITANGF